MQKVILGSIGAVGIVGTLVLLGGGLKATGLAAGLGEFAMFSGISIGVVLGLLGIFGIIARMH